MLYALVPCLCNIAAIMVIWTFPLDAGTHRKIRSAIQARRSGAAPLDPLRPGQQIAV